MIQQLIPLLTTEEFRHLPDQTTEVLNRLIMEVNDSRAERVELTNAIIALQKQIKELQPQPVPPTPTGEWRQLVQFDINHMGHTPQMCLANVCEGFGFAGGLYNSAREDMESQIANGTLHAGTPPSDIAVPIYYSNFYYTEYGHAAVWDHGVVYSDGVEYPSIDAVTTNYTGWGELVNSHRVVERVS